MLVLFYLLITIFIQIVLSLRHGAVVQHQQLVVAALFVCTCLQITSECNSRHVKQQDMGGFITLRTVIYHGIAKLLIGNNRATAVKILCKFREWGKRLSCV